mmetsp:Transcript_105189/g.297636  ORF Transcript_105189/g.297636 Transcript_105189/m.297636 type:complete len:225 (-) Transcript_105189:1219-1893(-)
MCGPKVTVAIVISVRNSGAPEILIPFVFNRTGGAVGFRAAGAARAMLRLRPDRQQLHVVAGEDDDLLVLPVVLGRELVGLRLLALPDRQHHLLVVVVAHLAVAGLLLGLRLEIVDLEGPPVGEPDRHDVGVGVELEREVPEEAVEEVQDPQLRRVQAPDLLRGQAPLPEQRRVQEPHVVAPTDDLLRAGDAELRAGGGRQALKVRQHPARLQVVDHHERVGVGR